MFQILTVCTANICRSPAAERILAAELADYPISVSSVGIEAGQELPRCQRAQHLTTSQLANVDLVPDNWQDTGSHPATKGAIEQADLILAMDRGHRGAIARLAPASRPRTFTLRQAAALAGGVATAMASPQGIPGAPPLPHLPIDRLHWLVSELDASRGLVPQQQPTIVEREPAIDPLDIPDPHIEGDLFHEPSARLIFSASTDLAAFISTVLGQAHV